MAAVVDLRRQRGKALVLTGVCLWHYRAWYIPPPCQGADLELLPVPAEHPRLHYLTFSGREIRRAFVHERLNDKKGSVARERLGLSVFNPDHKTSSGGIDMSPLSPPPVKIYQDF